MISDQQCWTLTRPKRLWKIASGLKSVQSENSQVKTIYYFFEKLFFLCPGFFQKSWNKRFFFILRLISWRKTDSAKIRKIKVFGKPEMPFFSTFKEDFLETVNPRGQFFATDETTQELWRCILKLMWPTDQDKPF